ncbi:G-protein coupled receptor family C group 6 member A [Melanotaenia boesemani]|uniref:G-protein coupled receptor family C group 6 member A n=1 Tax=Melanotaenia boesemani TaxID=1250792 RepID=UPI001C04D888|nr:G-protein coupled receptor family C group 6 member A [Melanotaenia boesemani]
MKYLLSFCIFLSSLSCHFFYGESRQEARAPGDIIIGGLFPIHESAEVSYASGKEEWTCSRVSTARLAQSLMMVHAVEEINERRELGNLKLGYHIVDSCGDVTTALRNTQSFMRGNDRTQQSPPPVLAVIGDSYSEISIAVTRQLNLENIPQISYGSTSGLLSDKNRFPSFMRTVPEDDHQARAIIEILKYHNWTWVGVVTTDGEYGRYAVERLNHHANKNNICIAFTSVLPDFLGDKMLNDSIDFAVKSITESKNVQVIVSFAKSNHMMYIFDKLLKNPQGRGKVWVASDSWSQSTNALNTTTWKLEDVGTVFGTNFKSGNSSKFIQFLRNLDVNPAHSKNNSFLSDFLKGEKTDSSNGTAIAQLINKTSPYAVFSIDLAVKAIAQAVTDLCINRKCNVSTLETLKFRVALRNTMFFMDGKNYSFDERGDIDSGYDVILWKEPSPSFLNTNNIVGFYDIKNQSLTFNSDKKQDLYHLTEVISRCSVSCEPGERKMSAEGQPVCCYQCEKCPKDHFSNTTDSPACHQCDTSTQYSKEGSSNCTEKEVVYLKWNDKYHIVVLAFTALGALLSLVVGIIFISCWKTPVVRSSVGPISILLLTSLFTTFVSVLLFGGRPNEWQCKARQVLFGLSFTMCISCILVKSFKIVLVFEFNPKTKSFLKTLYKPYVIIATCMAGQVLICAIWLALKSPMPMWDNKAPDNQLLMYCHENSTSLFGAMLGYIGFLALICLGVAYKGRKLPQSYNDAKFITFAMLIFSIAWIIFGPVYVTVTGKYLPAVEMVVILLSAYSILFCQFLTKCYIILFKQEANTVTAFRQDIRNYSLGKDTEENSIVIQNPVLSMESLPNLVPSDPLTDQRSFNNPPVTPYPSSPVLNPSPTMPQANLRLDRKRKQLHRYLSLPESAAHYSR